MTNKEKQRAVRVLLDKYDKKHLANLLRRKKVIDDLYNSVSREAARIGVACPFDDPDKPFYLDDYPATKARVDDLMEDFMQDLEVTIAEGSKEEWLLSASKNAAMIDILAKGTGIPKETLNRWKEPNLAALKAFQERKENGFNLSKRVWDLGQQTKSQLELAMDVGLGQGKSAAELSRDVRQYLKEPNKLFRRVRDKEGNLRLSKNAQAYHPGQGVYRSSYKNALRMTATETNMAYRTADHEKWNNLDFVIGYEIALSNNHTLNGKPFEDICDDLAGEYPKDFKFTGWHPFCRCIAIPILADFNEVMEHMNDEEYHYKGEITDLPDSFNEWMENNADRLENVKSMPYFIKDNIDQIERIGNIRIDENGTHKFGDKPKEAIIPHEIAEKPYEDPQNNKEPIFSDIQKENHKEIEKELNIVRTTDYMNHFRADSGNVNIDYNKGYGYNDNCAMCSFTYELRRRGFDVKSLPYNGTEGKNSFAFIAGEDKRYKELWKGAIYNEAKSSKSKNILTSLNEQTKSVGRYHLSWDWNQHLGHSITAERLNDGSLILYDAQKNRYYDSNIYFKNVSKIEVYRVDNILINPKAVNDIVTKRSKK